MAHVAKVIELVASSETSFDDAVKQGLAEAARTVRGIGGIEVVHWTADVENNQIVSYRVTLHIAFRIEHAEQ